MRTDNPTWRTDPYRFLFPLGYAFLVLGLGVWSVDLLGGIAHSETLHALLLGNGFFFAFAAGILLAEVPRATGTPPAGLPLLIGFSLAMTGMGGAALVGSFPAAYGCHLAAAALLFAFLAPRIRSRGALVPGPAYALAAAAFALAWTGLGAMAETGMLPRFLGREAALAGFQGFALFFCVACLRWSGIPAGTTRIARPWIPSAFLAFSLGLELASYYAANPDPWLRAAYGTRFLWALAWMRRAPSVVSLLSELPLYALCLRIGTAAVLAGTLFAAAVPSMSLTGNHLVFLGGFAWTALAAATGVIVERLDPRRRRGGLRLLGFAAFSITAAVAARALGLEWPAGRAVLLPLASSLALLPVLIWAMVMFTPLAEGKRA